MATACQPLLPALTTVFLVASPPVFIHLGLAGLTANVCLVVCWLVCYLLFYLGHYFDNLSIWAYIRPITLSKLISSWLIIATIVCNSIMVTNTQVPSPNSMVPNNPINIVFVFLVILQPMVIPEIVFYLLD